MGKQEIQDWSAKHQVGIRATFVPWSQSRNKDEKDDRGRPRMSLNWRVALYKAHRDILETDYMMGIGHSPAYKKIKRKSEPLVFEWDAVIAECERGGKGIEPGLHGVLASLSADSSVLDYATYEEWAGDIGYDPDSRKGEAIYRQCLEIALKMRAGLGEAALEELREACQDY